jgi:NADH dehydrogenase
VLWLAVHIFWLIGFDNRVLVLVRWAWAYFTSRRGARLITGPIEARMIPVAPADRSPPGE